jgi:uncharacterized protein (TIGR02453 family)
MTEYPDFSGFPQEGLDFLSQLVANNDREWFNARKHIFQEQVQKPAQQFVIALGQGLQTISPEIGFDTRLVGGSIMRIYRDVRFSKDKTPFNTNVRLVFWEGPSRKAMLSGFHVRLDASGGGVYVGRWHFDRAELDAFRDAVVDEELGSSLEDTIEVVRAAGAYTVGGEHYKRVPRGYDKDHPRSDLLRYNGLWAHTSDLDPAVITRPELVPTALEHCRNMAPLHNWIVRVLTQ